MDLVGSLERLAEQNLSGVSFLVAYGVTWTVCGLVWQRADDRVAALVTLFQGLVALPAALGISAVVGATGGSDDASCPDVSSPATSSAVAAATSRSPASGWSSNQLWRRASRGRA